MHDLVELGDRESNAGPYSVLAAASGCRASTLGEALGQDQRVLQRVAAQVRRVDLAHFAKPEEGELLHPEPELERGLHDRGVLRRVTVGLDGGKDALELAVGKYLGLAVLGHDSASAVLGDESSVAVEIDVNRTSRAV